MSEEMRYLLSPIVPLFRRVGENPAFKGLFFRDVLMTADTPSEAAGMIRLCEGNPFDEGETAELVMFFEGLGKSDIEGQRAHIERFMGKFGEILTDERATLGSRLKLAVTAPAALGLVAVIILV